MQARQVSVFTVYISFWPVTIQWYSGLVDMICLRTYLFKVYPCKWGFDSSKPLVLSMSEWTMIPTQSYLASDLF